MLTTPAFRHTVGRAKPLAISGPFGEQAQQLRELVELQVVRRQPASLGPRLREIGYAEQELDQIRAIIDVFSQGNYPYLLIATLVRMLLEGEDPRGDDNAPRFEGQRATPPTVPLVLMEAHHADATTRSRRAHACRSGRRAAKDAEVDAMLEVARRFQWLLPGLVVNVAFFPAQMRE